MHSRDYSSNFIFVKLSNAHDFKNIDSSKKSKKSHKKHGTAAPAISSMYIYLTVCKLM